MAIGGHQLMGEEEADALAVRFRAVTSPFIELATDLVGDSGSVVMYGDLDGVRDPAHRDVDLRVAPGPSDLCGGVAGSAAEDGGLGDAVATDGVIVEGGSKLDTALITGESKPVDVAVGAADHRVYTLESASILRAGGNAGLPAAVGAAGGVLTLAVSPLIIFGR